MFALTALLTLLAPDAHAFVDPACEGETQAGEDAFQERFLLDFFALATTMSPMHAPVPHRPGTGAISLELDVIPPLSCKRRLVLNSSKTEDTNKAPVAPRPRMSFAFPQLGPAVVYGGVAYVPPVTVFGTRNVIMSGEIGVGFPMESGLEVGARYHATLMKTVAEIATPFVDGDPAYDDFYSGSTFGVDAMAGYALGPIKPYIAAGFTDVSTLFLIGDDLYVAGGVHPDDGEDAYKPYFGFTGSVGAQATLRDHLDLAGEFYTAPGRIYTGRVRVGYVF